MRIEEFLLNNGNNYTLRVIDKKDGMIQIEIRTDLFDGDGSIQEYLVKDNILFPINTELKRRFIMGSPIYDISDAAAKQLGFTREDFVKSMNSKKIIKKYFKGEFKND